MKIFKSIIGLFLLFLYAKRFKAKKIFKGKRIAVIGAADSVMQEKNGDFIDTFDYVIRINKAITSWKDDKTEFTGVKSNILFHSFYENTDRGGGGPLNLELFNKREVQYLVQPRSNNEGWRVMFNFFKKYISPYRIYTFTKQDYDILKNRFHPFKPTIGFCALFAVLTSPCAEVYITGFTFFKTPYAQGYRDHLLDMKANDKHIKDQGQHDPDLEFTYFKQLASSTMAESVIVDQQLFDILGEKEAHSLGIALKR